MVYYITWFLCNFGLYLIELHFRTRSRIVAKSVLGKPLGNYLTSSTQLRTLSGDPDIDVGLIYYANSFGFTDGAHHINGDACVGCS